MSPINIALVGAGRIGFMHAGVLRAHADTRLCAVCDANVDAAKHAAGDGGDVAVTDDANAVFTNENIDAVLIASPTGTHCDYIERAAGKAVLCEKPLAQPHELSRANQCAEHIKNKKEAVQLGFNRRHDPGHSELQQRIQNGDIGKLEKLVITSRDPAPPPLEYLKASGGLFADMMIHDFDIARFILNDEPARICASGAALFDDNAKAVGDIDTAMVIMQTTSGVLCHINCSRRACYGYDQRIEAFGEKGMLVSGNPRQSEVRAYGETTTAARAPLKHFFTERYADSYRRQIGAFAKAARGEVLPSPDFEDGRRALILAKAANDSLREQRWIEVNY